METFHDLGTPKRVILGSVDNQNEEFPISPTANLKLLTKVAISYMDENSAVFPYAHDKKKTPVKNRRQLRSLGYICKRFLGIYSLNMAAGESKQISLGNLTVLLDIEKRRVYDIINIIASLRFASKVCKDKYSWFGSQYLVSTLCELRSLAYARKYHLLLNEYMNNNISDGGKEEDRKGFVLEQLCDVDSQVFDDNRIGALCQKSIMLFLVAPKGESLNFKIISQIILPQDVQDKTGMRRLYDISNVLESLGLITRCENKHMKRPCFSYSGPELPANPNNVAGLPAACRRLTDIEHLSDTSLDGSGSEPVSNLLDLCGTECGAEESQMPAKKRLFPQAKWEQASSRLPVAPSAVGFVKAPCSSFRFSPSGLVSVGSVASSSPCLDQGALVSAVGRIPRPLVYKISNPNSSLQNGGIYRVVKQGNIINLVKLKPAH